MVYCGVAAGLISFSTESSGRLCDYNNILSNHQLPKTDAAAWTGLRYRVLALRDAKMITQFT